MERAREFSSLNASSPGTVKSAGKLALRRKKYFLEGSKQPDANAELFSFQ
jgi:hypothetical protein